MDQVVQSFNVDLEDGELSESDDGYTPLERPAFVSSKAENLPRSNEMQISSAQMNEVLEDDTQSDFGQSSDSTSADSDACLKKIAAVGKNSNKKKTKRAILVRDKQFRGTDNKKPYFKKYDIWTSSLQEDDLTENMRGIDVTKKSGTTDRNVESYDYTQKFRYMEENCLKRRLSASMDDHSSNDSRYKKKKMRTGESIKNRLGQRCQSSASSASDTSNEPRHILDLDDLLGRDKSDIAREIANKLYEEKDDLMQRVLEVCGTELPVEIYKETQRIEADGGMLIKTGQRRRTPGGVFFFLLKNHERVTSDEQKLIFFDERKNFNKVKKETKAMVRHRKVEELKKRLSAKGKDISTPTMSKVNYLGSELNVENKRISLSNPPPSPVGQDQSPEYKSHAINHILHDDVISEKQCTSTIALTSQSEPRDTISNITVSYDDDFLDVHCGDMDLF